VSLTLEPDELGAVITALDSYLNELNYREAELGNPAPIRAPMERAMMKAGELLRAMEKAKAAPGNQHTGKLDPSPDQRGPKTPGEWGVSKAQSHQWHKLADVPREDFEAALAAASRTQASIAKPLTRLPWLRAGRRRQ
jgi:hypothetical protein